MAKRTPVWAIESYNENGPAGLIETSQGYPFAELRRIARHMSHGDGYRYRVVQVYPCAAVASQTAVQPDTMSAGS